MFRYSVVILSLLMLGLTFNAPSSDWPVDIHLFGYSLQGNLFGWLFTTCLIAFVPLLLITVVQLIRYGLQYVKTRSASAFGRLLLFALVPLAALIRFNAWVFSEIF